MSNCAGYIAVLNKRGSSSYGTCDYYDRYPSQLWWCFKYPGSIWGQYRDNVATCFRNNKPSATAYCSSYLSIQPSTVTLTTTTTTTNTTTVTVTRNGAKVRRHEGWPFVAAVTATPTPGSEAVIDEAHMLEMRAGPTANAAIRSRNNLPRLSAIVTKVIRRTTTVQPPYCLNPAMVPAAKVSSACTCLSIPKP